MSIFLFFGEEDFLIEEELNRLKLRLGSPCLPAGSSSFSSEVLDGEEPDLDKIIFALQTPPMFAKDKLVVIKNADLRREEWERLVPVLENIPEKIKLVIIASAVDRRTRIYKLIDEIGEAREYRSFAEWEGDKVIAWIEHRLAEAKKRIDLSAARLLFEISGKSLRKLASEIDKLVTYVGERKRMVESDVSAVASRGELSVFALLDALRSKDLKKSLIFITRLLQVKEDPIPLLGLLASQLRLMLQVKSLPRSDNDAKQLAGRLGASPYSVRKCLESAHNFSVSELIRDLELLHDADLRMKTGEDQSLILEVLLTELCRNKLGENHSKWNQKIGSLSSL